MKVENRSQSSRAPLADENSVESMRASKSSIQCRIFLFHCGGTIWRTSARFPRFVIRFQHPLYELRKTKGTGKSQILAPLFDLKLLVGLAACGAATSIGGTGTLVSSQRSSTRGHR